MRVAVRLLVLVVVLLASSCARDVGPQLIEVLDLAPHEVEAGDRVEILGASFPQGKHSKLAFRGMLHRPGERPESAEIAAEGDATSATQIAIDFTEGLQQVFCGAGERSAHTTFDGDVEIAFPAATAGAPAVTATLRAVTLDVRPPTPRRALLDARRREGENALAYMGIKATKTSPPSGGIVVESIAPGSRADKAGIQVNDLLTSLDKLRLDSLADAIPSGAHLLATFTLRRGTAPAELTREVHIESYRASPPAELYAAALLVLIAVAVLLLFMAPTAGLLTAVERRVAARMQSRIGASPAVPGGTFGVAGGLRMLFAQGAVPPASDSMLFRLAPYLVFAGVSASFVVMPFGQYLIAADLDVGVLYVLAITSLVTIGLLSGGWASNGKYSLLGGIRSAVQIVSYGVPGAIAVACIVMMTGSLRLQEIIHAQGGWPWEWFLFKNPVTFALFCLYFTTALAEGNRAPFDLPEADGESAAARAAPRAGTRDLFFFLAEWANVFVMCGIAAALFMGGWQVPGLSTGAEEAHLGLQILGALLFLVKAWALILVVLSLRWAWPRVRIDQRMTLCWKWLVPMAFVAFVMCAGWVAWSPGRALQTAMGVGMFTVFCLGLARFAQRVRYNLRATPADVRLNPFL